MNQYHALGVINVGRYICPWSQTFGLTSDIWGSVPTEAQQGNRAPHNLTTVRLAVTLKLLPRTQRGLKIITCCPEWQVSSTHYYWHADNVLLQP